MMWSINAKREDIRFGRWPRAGRAGFLFACLAMAGLPAACTRTEPTAATAGTAVVDAPPELQRLYRETALQGPRNEVLNQMRVGLAALQAGRPELAAASFDAAERRIETIYAENPAAEQARLAWYKAGAKDFLGDAYERAMAYYYRGLIDLMRGDYESARAAFHAGLLQDSFMEENQRMTAEFGALAFLEGWAGRCAGADPAAIAAAFATARERNAALAQPPAAENILVLFETGTGPRKTIGGTRRGVLSYQPGAVPAVSAVTASFGGRSVPAIQAADLFFQATTRAGRWVVAVDQGKVIYQNTAPPEAPAAAAGGTPAPPTVWESTATAIAGVADWVGETAADITRTEADARYWDNLPGNILLATFVNPAGRPRDPDAPSGARALVNFERTGQPQLRQLQTIEAGACVIAWGHEVPATNIADAAPHSAAAH